MVSDVIDVIVVGGSFAGMAAALQLARARRRVLVIDAGQRRNRFAAHAHGLPGMDGAPPEEIAATARAQLLAYPTVDWLEGTAAGARKSGDGFAVDLAGLPAREGKRLVIATGVTDELPAVPGLAERWGKSVFHCPYCHGYEMTGGPAGVLACHPLSVHQAEVVADWGETIFFANGTPLDGEHAAALDRRGVAVEADRIVEIAGEIAGDGADIRLADGRTIGLAGLYLLPKTAMASPIAAQLGCAVEDGMTGPFLRVDATMKTTVDGVYACGDAVRTSGFIHFALSDGAVAGVGAHQSLIYG
jgi:thioredoxin reductase